MMNIDFNVNNVFELDRVLGYVEKLHDNIIITVDNDDYECLNVYFDEIYQNYNLDVIDMETGLIINDFIVENLDEIREMIIDSYYCLTY